MIKTIYNAEMDKDTLTDDLIRLTNQIWKLIPMRENDENWKNHLNGLINEISGLSVILDLDEVILLSKLEGLKTTELDFLTYRNIVFRCITLLNRIFNKYE